METLSAVQDVTLAILPFQINFDEEQLSPIIHNFSEDLANNFAGFEGLSVISYFSTQFLNLSEKDTLQKLGVDYVITGSVRSTEDNLAINIQLLNFDTMKILFSKKYLVNRQDILLAEDQITLQIVNIIHENLDTAILQNSYKKNDIQLVAYEYWLIGNDYLKKRTPSDDQRARNYFEKALEINPNFARAYSGISMSYFNEWSCQLWDRWEISQKGAHKFALKAIEQDENDYISLAVLGRTYLYLREYEKAEYYLRKSLNVNSNDANILAQIAMSLMLLGHYDEAEEKYRRACKLNPLHGDQYLTIGTAVLFECGKCEEALALGRKVDVKNAYVDFAVYMAASCYCLELYNEAVSYWSTFLERFNEHIYFSDKPNDQEALSWHIDINPYQSTTRLESFRKFIAKKQNIKVVEKGTDQANLDKKPSIQVTDEYFTITFRNNNITIKDCKGIRDIIQLLESPNQEIHCLELMGTSHQENGIEVLDPKAKQQYKQKILELQEALNEAENNNDSELATHLNQEYEMLMDHLSQAVGLNGKVRTVGATVDKARAAVTLRIRGVIKKIKAIDHHLATHLDNSLKTGVLCSYRPENKVEWAINY